MYLHEISCTFRARIMTRSYLCLQAHITYEFLQDSGATQCLINWLDFFPESFSITSVTFLHSRGFSYHFIWHQLMQAYQINHKLLFLPKCILLNFHHSWVSKEITKNEQSIFSKESGKERRGEKKLLTNFSWEIARC